MEQTPYIVRRHEIKHTEQYERLGIDGFIKEYSYQLVYNLLTGMAPFEAYKNINLELEAKEEEVCKKECVRFE